jgi:hypothetical protein
MHPENQPPFDVLLSQLGTFQYRDKYQNPVPPTAAPAATNTPAPSGADCSGIPASQNQTVTPPCGPRGTTFSFSGGGFKPGELVGIYATQPSGAVFGAPFQAPADANGNVSGITLRTDANSELGIWADSMEGTQTHAKSIGYFKVTGTAPPTQPPSGGSCDVSGNKNGSASPSAVHTGDTIRFTATGFRPGEAVSFWFTTPDGLVVGTRAPATGLVNADGSVGPLPLPVDTFFTTFPGRWAITFQGASSANQAIIYFCVAK